MIFSWLDIVLDMFKYFVDINFISLVLVYNLLYYFKVDVVKGFYLKILDLLYFEFGNLIIICFVNFIFLFLILENF